MKLINHVLDIRRLIQQAFDNRFSRMGLRKEAATPVEQIPAEHQEKRRELDELMSSHLSELGDYTEARQAAINECVFTLFNRIAAIKVMESKELFPEIITRRKENAGRSFEHNVWLENHPEERNAEREGLKHFLSDQFDSLGEHIPLYRKDYPYALLPTADELNEIIEKFNAVEADADCGADVWKGDDILGWLYENFNAVEKEALKQSGEKTEYNKVSLQSQVYTPQWVVKFLVDNTLGKAYMEMFPDSRIKEKYQIANIPAHQVRHPKDLRQMRLLDPACGSGNFLIYAFSLFYDLYVDQMEHYESDYSRRDIPKMIVENNLFGVDLDERAAQISQIALFIKARELGGHRSHWPEYTNVVSTHFFLDDYEKIKDTFETIDNLDESKRIIMRMIWGDLSNAYKFGSLVRVDETLDKILPNDANHNLFAQEQMEDMFSFKQQFMNQLRQKVNELGELGSNAYTLAKTNDAISFLEIIANKYDVVVANPPYTDSGDFGTELKAFVEENYRKPLKFNSNLYACFIKRCCELAGDDGKVGMIHPMTFMYIKTFEDVRKFILDETHIDLFVEYGLSNLFGSIMVDPAFYVLDMNVRNNHDSIFISLDQYTRTPQEKYKKEYCLEALGYIIANQKYMRENDYIVAGADGDSNNYGHHLVYALPQSKLKGIKSYPFIYWISDEFREKFKNKVLKEVLRPAQGIATTNNNRFLRFWWEVSPDFISNDVEDKKKWKYYSKGGPFLKWWGNLWLLCNWADEGKELKDSPAVLRNPSYYFKEGITYSAVGSKGVSFRYMPSNCLFDSKGPGIFPASYKNIYYSLAILNSKLAFYICDCLDPTVSINQGDLDRIPWIVPNEETELFLSCLSKSNINTRKLLTESSLIEPLFRQSPITNKGVVQTSLLSFYNTENAFLTQILLNESIINKIVFEVYELSEHDKQMVLDKEGIPVGDLPVSHEAKVAYLKWLGADGIPAVKSMLGADGIPAVKSCERMNSMLGVDGIPAVKSCDRVNYDGRDAVGSFERVNCDGKDAVGSYERVNYDGRDAVGSFERVNYDGKDAVGSYPQFMDKKQYIHITADKLPHWYQQGRTQFVTFRLADSLPQTRLQELTAYKEEWLKQHPQPWDEQTKEEHNREIRHKVDRWLDQGHGSCLLADTKLRKIVEDALKFYQDKLYTLHAYVIMPNHVHVLLTPVGDTPVTKSIGRVKSYTSTAINKITGCSGALWQDEVFDRLVRDGHNFERYLRYIAQNPASLAPDTYTLGADGIPAVETHRRQDDVSGFRRQDAAAPAVEPATVGADSIPAVETDQRQDDVAAFRRQDAAAPTAETIAHLVNLEERDDLPKITDFDTLYQNNNGWEEFCIKHKMNPVEVWWQFKNATVLPPQRTQVLAFELLTDVIRTVLAKDDDGIIPLGDRLGEERLAIRIEKEMMERGYSAAQFSQVCQLLGCGLEKYLQERFFQQLSDHLNLFMYLPKTPFIWHLSSGPHHAIELYVSIYKWSRDKLYRVRSIYAANREAALRDRLNSIDTSNTEGRMEAQELRATLTELQEFCQKVDDLLATGYDPKLDDGVGKNIAPLQKRKMLSYEVLNAGQLKKYLNADW